MSSLVLQGEWPAVAVWGPESWLPVSWLQASWLAHGEDCACAKAAVLETCHVRDTCHGHASVSAPCALVGSVAVVARARLAVAAAAG